MATMLTLMSLVLSIAVASAPAHSQLRAEGDIERATATQEAEVSLAKGQAAYAVLDLKEGNVKIKARGIVLKALPFTGLKLSGGRLPAQPVKLISKKSFSVPRRENIKPSGGEEDAQGDPYDVKALEVQEMPSSYRLVFEDGTSLDVVPHAEGFLRGRLGELMSKAWGGAARPFRRLWHAVSGKSICEAALEMDAADAKSLYWHLGDGTKVLVLND